jgi:hypothetical protein
MKLLEIRAKMLKEEGSKPRIIDVRRWKRDLESLEPGTYEVIVRPVESKLKQLKKVYFSMESELAYHLGYKKTELHEQLKEFIGKHVSPDNGKVEYLSVAKITSEDDISQRILELSEFAAKELNYVFKPYDPAGNT